MPRELLRIPARDLQAGDELDHDHDTIVAVSSIQSDELTTVCRTELVTWRRFPAHLALTVWRRPDAA